MSPPLLEFCCSLGLVLSCQIMTTCHHYYKLQVSVGRNEQGEQYMIEKEATMQHPVGAEDMYGDSSIPAGPRYQYQPRNVYM